MPWALDPIELHDADLTVRPLREEDLPAASRALVDPDGWSGRTWGATTPEGARRYLEKHLEMRANGESLSLIYFLGDLVAGVTALHNVHERRKVIEVGFTSVAPRFRRTAVNTRVKALLLAHCFDTLGAVRVELRVDVKNFVSQLAVLRLGARFDGRIDQWVVREGDPHPVGHIYSVTCDRWPAVRAHLATLREGRPPDEPFLAPRLAGPRLRLERSKLADAPALFALLQKDRETIAQSFPQLGRLETLDDVKSYIAERAHWAAAGSGFHFVARDQTYSSVIGHVQIKNVEWAKRSCELGYLLAPEFRRQGYGTELLALVVRELRDRLDFARITLRILPENAASLALAAKLGFETEGVLRSEHVTSSGERKDVALMALVRTSAPTYRAAVPAAACAAVPAV
jgi:RimJ/RimL family protein N-acetyltransferase